MKVRKLFFSLEKCHFLCQEIDIVPFPGDDVVTAVDGQVGATRLHLHN